MAHAPADAAKPWSDAAVPTPLDQLRAVQATARQHAADQELWLNLRRGLLFMVDAIERYQGIPSVIEQYERRQSARKS